MSAYRKRPLAISVIVSASTISVYRQELTSTDGQGSRKECRGENRMPEYYPVMLDVRGRLAIVVGGDRVAAEKAAALSASGAHVSVINSAFCDELLMQAEYKRVTLRRKAYEPGDLEGAFVVVAATNDAQLVEAIWTETQKSGQPVNIVDIPERCSFIMH